MPSSSSMPESTRQKTPFSIKLIRWLVQKELVEEIEGNLMEFHHFNQEEQVKFPLLRYWREVLNYLRPSTLKKFENSKYNGMFNFNPILTIRSLFKQGSSTVINIGGFALGLVCVLFLYFHLQSELTYDDFHEDGDRIFRVLRQAPNGDVMETIGVTSGPYAPALANDYPNSIQSTCRVQPTEILVTFDDKKFFEENIVMADSNFFSFFSYPLFSGTADEVMNGINEAVLSKETAKRFFGNEDPIGKIIKLDNQEDFIITGIMDELPSANHLGDFSMVININGTGNLEGWWNNGLLTYVKVNSVEEAAYLGGQLDAFMDKYLGDSFEDFGLKVHLILEPMDKVYFNNRTIYDYARHGDMNTIYILSLVGFAILLIACFNYVNLAIAQSFKRAKEIAIRKVLGGYKSRLILQFLGESLTILLFATSIAVALSLLLSPLFNEYFGLNIQFDWTDPNVLLFGAIILGVTLLVAGLYPALLLSSFHPLKVLKGSKGNSGKNVMVRKSLVVAQFLIAIFMIATTLLISRQLNFVQNKELGFNREAIMLLDINNQDIFDNLDAFKGSFEGNPNIEMVSLVGGEPGGFHDVSTIDFPGMDENPRLNFIWADENYFETFGIGIAHGRSFADNVKTEAPTTAVINLAALKALNMEAADILETKVTVPGWELELRIIGISEDFHYSSLKEKLEPMMIVNGLRYRRVAIKMNAANVNEAIASVSDNWERFSPNYPMEYDFLDESIARLYEHEAQQNKVFIAFAAISIFLACMGVFGLATYTARQRQKELGIRKVLGATAQQIIGLLSKEFILLVSISSIIAMPAAWYFMSEWLTSFAYQIDLASNWATFLISGLAVSLVAFLTIGFNTYRAAVSNPTESIRYE